MTISVKTRIACTKKKKKKKKKKKTQNLKIICEIVHAAGNYEQELMEPSNSKESFKSTKTIYSVPPYLPGYGEFENLCFVSVA